MKDECFGVEEYVVDVQTREELLAERERHVRVLLALEPDDVVEFSRHLKVMSDIRARSLQRREGST